MADGTCLNHGCNPERSRRAFEGMLLRQPLFISLKIQQSLKLQALYFLQRPSGNALEVAVHADGRLHDALELFVTLRLMVR